MFAQCAVDTKDGRQNGYQERIADDFIAPLDREPRYVFSHGDVSRVFKVSGFTASSGGESEHHGNY